MGTVARVRGFRFCILEVEVEGSFEFRSVYVVGSELRRYYCWGDGVRCRF